MAPGIDERLAAVLACPADHHSPLELSATDSGEQLTCPECGRVFRVDGDIPVLLLDDAVDAS